MTDKLLTTLLEQFLVDFTTDVLVPTQISAQRPLLVTRPEELPKEHVYWSKRKKLIRKIRRYIQSVLIDKPESPGYPDYPKALVGGYSNDLVNLYVGELLGDIGILGEDWKTTIFSSDHPYLREKDRFIYYKAAVLIDVLFP